MTFAATSQVLHDGQRNVVMQFTGLCDGSGQELNVVKVDVSALTPPTKSLYLYKAQYTVVGGILQLLWGADTPVPFLNLEGHDEFDYCRIGGIKNIGVDAATGDILFTTLGFESGSSYSIKLDMKKSGPS